MCFQFLETPHNPGRKVIVEPLVLPRSYSQWDSLRGPPPEFHCWPLWDGSPQLPVNLLFNLNSRNRRMLAIVEWRWLSPTSIIPITICTSTVAAMRSKFPAHHFPTSYRAWGLSYPAPSSAHMFSRFEFLSFSSTTTNQLFSSYKGSLKSLTTRLQRSHACIRDLLQFDRDQPDPSID